MSDNQYQKNANGETDVLELAAELWSQKLVIFLSILICATFALGYCALATPTYMSQITIAPGPINLYGAIAGESKRELQRSTESPISLGAALSNDAFRLYLTNLESSQFRSAFREQVNDLEAYVGIEVKKGRNTHFLDEPATIYAESSDGEVAKEYLEALVEYASITTLLQINEYFTAMGVSQSVVPAALLTVERPATVSNTPVRPRRPLALVLGVVLGTMIGVFIAITRLIIRNRHSNYGDAS